MKKFKLAGITWVVKRTSMADLGSTNPDESVILINDKLEGQSYDVTLMHEIVHAILFTMGERNHDERFVEGFAQLLYQYEQQKI
jgi:Zn-dependent peptidase ImmA (M78 family)